MIKKSDPYSILESLILSNQSFIWL